jgi:ATP-dependent HslUV protease ATP-binding subunit HslU
VEATQFTEVGYVGKDVDSIIRDLMEIAVKQLRESEKRKLAERAHDAAEERILDVLLPQPRYDSQGDRPVAADNPTRQVFRKKLREGQLNDREIDIDLASAAPMPDAGGPPGMEAMGEQMRELFGQLGQARRKTRKLKIVDALRLLVDEEAAKLVNEDDLHARALNAVEQNGIVFIDEIDKVTSRNEGESSGGEVSRQGVQRDLLPLVEGSSVSTKYGMVRTDHILFVASGAFHFSRPSDLIPELQGRFPIRVELQPLGVADFEAILTQTHASLVRQYQALLATEGVTLQFTPKGVTRLAAIAFDVNERTDNIGARRLSTVMEKLLDDVSFDAAAMAGQTIVIDGAYVDARLGALSRDEDQTRFVL